MENWRDVIGFEGDYLVSDMGRVASCKKGNFFVLKPYNEKDGYCIVSLIKGPLRKTWRVHRLVAVHFIPNTEGKLEVNHIDEDKTNNTKKNLEWCTRQENIDHGTYRRRMRLKNVKPVVQLTYGGSFVRDWSSMREAGRNGYTAEHISMCCNGKLKTHAGYIWRFKNEKS